MNKVTYSRPAHNPKPSMANAPSWATRVERDSSGAWVYRDDVFSVDLVNGKWVVVEGRRQVA